MEEKPVKMQMGYKPPNESVITGFVGLQTPLSYVNCCGEENKPNHMKIG